MKNMDKITPSTMADRILESIISGFEDPSKLILYHSSNHYIQDIVKELTSKYQEYKVQLELNKK